jgi:3-dehydro-L-gulonate 2-dehydrogenase
MENSTVRISVGDMEKTFTEILLKNGFSEDRAKQCAAIFTNNSVDGVYTHGVYRFPRFIEYIRKGVVHPDATPGLVHRTGALEQWNGNQGPGPLNAMHATNTAMKISQEHGIGCVALANTNHWMRGGTYGWQAAKAGFVFIGWTNTTASMPAWGALNGKLGNNPLVMGLPYKNEAIILDMAMSQYSFGAMELAVMKKEKLPVYGGYDSKGQLTVEPAEILQSRRPIPIGYWKGAGLALLLDILAAVLSGGLAVHEIAKKETESSLSQVFIAIDLKKLENSSSISQLLDNIISDYHQSAPEDKKRITFPGERVLHTRKDNLDNGVPVLEKFWKEILSLTLQ